MSNSKKQIKRRPWPEKRRQEQAERIRKTRPWKRATGPKTAAGKAASCQNALKHGFHSAEMIHLRSLLRAQKAFVKKTLNTIIAGRSAGAIDSPR